MFNYFTVKLTKQLILFIVYRLMLNRKIDHFPFLAKKLFSMDLKFSYSSALLKIGGCAEQPLPPDIPENKIAWMASLRACSDLYFAPFFVSHIFMVT
jgi:hypothetical protein